MQWLNRNRSNKHQHSRSNRELHSPTLDPPGNFNIPDAGKWTSWTTSWKRYRDASRINEQPKREKINTLIYSFGEQAEDNLSRNIPKNPREKVPTISDDYFSVRTNIIVERTKFNKL